MRIITRPTRIPKPNSIRTIQTILNSGEIGFATGTSKKVMFIQGGVAESAFENLILE